MNKFSVAAVMSLATLFGASTTVFASEQECKKLKNEHDIIYAAKGFCFKDPEAKAKFNDECRTPNPKFNEKEKQKLDEIKQRQKELNCK
ncbi:YARHG domain-containing protein [Acinetobacter sp. NCu2D-2]|uniref:YARHG domain-containing protein n=1 Tax=Acinetobacter sp. NCu2D-2 TaxID=1608473 RepID=UPI0007CDC273|nr:YARHG domain-containing protein [Acinetobacter sp. NCu2D-2]ANF81861.1 YARHG domain-containing protein [Acinetobacter sp. NCu2D-2]